MANLRCQPNWVVHFVIFVCCFTIPIYILNPPEHLSTHFKQEDSNGFWTTNSDFNWCEPNYNYTHYIAEPINTWTNLFFIIIPAVFYYLHYKNNLIKIKKKNAAKNSDIFHPNRTFLVFTLKQALQHGTVILYSICTHTAH